MRRSFFTPFIVIAAITGSLAETNETENFWNTHIRIVNLDGALRYAYADAAPGLVLRRQLEYRGTVNLRFQLQRSGRTYLQARAQTGPFHSAFDATAVGLSAQRSAFNVKSFYIGQKLGEHIELEAGGIDYDYGAGSEATYGATSGWMNGYRIRVNSHAAAWRPARVSVTVGYVGDFLKPNFFSRAARMGDVNYLQVLAQKPLAENVEASIEYNSIGGIGLSRDALLWKQIPARLFDEAQLEGNIRATDYLDIGWAATAKKHFLPQFQGQLSLRYSQIPRDFFLDPDGRTALLNGGEISLGKRGAVLASARPTAKLEAGFLVSRRLDADPLNKRWRALGYVSYDFRELASRLMK